MAPLLSIFNSRGPFPHFQFTNYPPKNPFSYFTNYPHQQLLLRRSHFPPPFHRRSAAASLADMESNAGQGVYPLHRCKTIHLVRHAQGIHNVEGEKDHDAYMSEELFDAHLTPLGWQQVDNLKKHVHACGLSKRIELVVVSPLLRTIQTAVGVFGGEGYNDGIDVPPLMVENAGNSNRPAISSLNCPPFVAVELCREHLNDVLDEDSSEDAAMDKLVEITNFLVENYVLDEIDLSGGLAMGVHPCDRRRSISEYRPIFPAIDFSLIENEDDVLWTADVREKDEALAERGMKFMNWLWTREEKEIAVVTHSGFLFHTLNAYGNDCHPSVKKEMASHFKNCELRSVVIVDRSMIGSDSSKTNYPGKIPAGPDLPSEAAD